MAVLFVGVMILMAGSVSVVIALDQQEPSASVQSPDTEINGSPSVQTTADGRRYIVHPDELEQGCPGFDCIPAIDDPAYINADQASWLDNDDRVIGLSINNVTRAYPLRILNRHEIVNDRIGGDPVAITYCPLCRSAVVFNRTINGSKLSFGVSGKLLDANLVMYDRQTETLWNQIEGQAIVGSLVPSRLELLYASITSWGDWQQANPDTDVLARDQGIYPVSSYDVDPYAGYGNQSVVGFGVDKVDDRLHPKKLVAGISIEGTPKAYPVETIKARGMIQESVNGTSVAVFQRKDDGRIGALIAEYEGTRLELTRKDHGLQDQQGRLWRYDGQQSEGDGRLTYLVPKEFYWFAWEKFNSESLVYTE